MDVLGFFGREADESEVDCSNAPGEFCRVRGVKQGCEFGGLLRGEYGGVDDPLIGGPGFVVDAGL